MHLNAGVLEYRQQYFDISQGLSRSSRCSPETEPINMNSDLI